MPRKLRPRLPKARQSEDPPKYLDQVMADVKFLLQDKSFIETVADVEMMISLAIKFGIDKGMDAFSNYKNHVKRIQTKVKRNKKAAVPKVPIRKNLNRTRNPPPIPVVNQVVKKPTSNFKTGRITRKLLTAAQNKEFDWRDRFFASDFSATVNEQEDCHEIRSNCQSDAKTRVLKLKRAISVASKTKIMTARGRRQETPIKPTSKENTNSKTSSETKSHKKPPSRQSPSASVMNK